MTEKEVKHQKHQLSSPTKEKSSLNLSITEDVKIQ